MSKFKRVLRVRQIRKGLIVSFCSDYEVLTKKILPPNMVDPKIKYLCPYYFIDVEQQNEFYEVMTIVQDFEEAEDFFKLVDEELVNNFLEKKKKL